MPKLSFINVEFDHQNVIRQDYNDRIPKCRKHRLHFPTIAKFRKCQIPKLNTAIENRHIYHSSFFRPPDRKIFREVVTVFDMIPERFGENAHQYLQAWIKRKAVTRADAIICISHSTRADLLDILPKTSHKKIAVVHLGVSEIFRPLIRKQLPDFLLNHKPYILFIGRRGGYKNFVSAVKAVGMCNSYHLVAVGGGPLSIDENRLVANVLNGRFVHIPESDEILLNQLYNGAFCLLYPSSYEGFGLPVVEAMRAGCPVVAVKTSSVPELVEEAFPLAACEDPDALFERIGALENNDVRSSAINLGRLRSQFFTWDKCVRGTMEVYQSLL